jgi:hypothetical protein
MPSRLFHLATAALFATISVRAEAVLFRRDVMAVISNSLLKNAPMHSRQREAADRARVGAGKDGEAQAMAKE